MVLRGPYVRQALPLDQQDSVRGEIVAISDISSGTQETRIPPRAARLRGTMWSTSKALTSAEIPHSSQWNCAFFNTSYRSAPEIYPLDNLRCCQICSPRLASYSASFSLQSLIRWAVSSSVSFPSIQRK